MVIAILFISVIVYYFLFPNRNWLGKPYLEPTQNNGFAVVELFTSEGCSSCPPADELMAKIQKESGGKKIYFLAFHVDYWNDSDWKDQFSSAEYTERQQQYASWMKSELLYTPQFIINGTSEFGGDDTRTLYRIVSNALDKKPESTLALAVEDQQDFLSVEFKTNNTGNNNSLFIALVQKNGSTDVKRGENGGHLLHHVQIVRQTSVLPLEKKDGLVTISKPEGFNTKDWELIGFIQSKSTGAISAAAKADF